jgi:hypothetical protein
MPMDPDWEDKILEALREVLKTHDATSVEIDPESLQAGRQVIVEIKFRPKPKLN